GILKDFSLKNNFAVSYWLIIIYCAVYAIWGTILGWWISKLPTQIETRSEEINLQLHNALYVNLSVQSENTHKKNISIWLYMIGVLTFIVLVFSMSTINGNQKALHAVLRTVAALLTWFVFVQPVLKFLISRYANKKQNEKKLR